MIINTTRASARFHLRLRRLLAAAGLAALLLGLGHYLLASYRVADGLTRPFHGFKPGETPATYQIAYQDVRFPARGGDVRIAGWYLPRAGSQRAVVLVHGKSVNRWIEFGGGFLKLAVALHARGFTVLMIDLRAHGESEGERAGFSLHERRDVIGAVDWLKQQGYAPGSVGVLGVSMGAVASIGAAADDSDIGALVADCGFADVDVLLRRQWGAASGGLPDFYRPATIAIGKLLGYDFYGDHPVEEIGRIAPRPVLIIHGDADALVPLSDAEQLKAAGRSSELWVVHGAGHGGSYWTDPQAYTERVAAFFDQHLKATT